MNVMESSIGRMNIHSLHEYLSPNNHKPSRVRSTTNKRFAAGLHIPLDQLQRFVSVAIRLNELSVTKFGMPSTCKCDFWVTCLGWLPSRINLTLLLASVMTLLSIGTANGTSYDVSLRPPVLLPRSGQFVAQDIWKGVAIYRLSDMGLVHRFRAHARINKFSVTSDEKVLLLVGNDSYLSVHEIATGGPYWELSASDSGLDFVTDVCFSHDGHSFIICDCLGQALILETKTGRRIGAVRFPPGQITIESAALSPDGSRGVLLGGHLFAFDVATEQLQDTGVTGARPVRYSLDGKHVVLRSNSSEKGQQLRIVNVNEGWAVRDVGDYHYIIRIKPIENGSFLATSISGDGNFLAGVRCWPNTGRIENVRLDQCLQLRCRLRSCCGILLSDPTLSKNWYYFDEQRGTNKGDDKGDGHVFY